MSIDSLKIIASVSSRAGLDNFIDQCGKLFRQNLPLFGHLLPHQGQNIINTGIKKPALKAGFKNIYQSTIKLKMGEP
ncbi:hypothetical protein EAY03_04550 [Vibrio anguillarum]|uniref:Uncharacterized protein n=1 Tax=Vibrio anguillarum TaxID=55601 RepID=A0A289GEX2_VIBAN|nr:hypothetical protein [Vibrio anguillarum]ASW82039.1 hypothetical protein CK207_13430 [Vibrio anguillarum]AZS24595.1 hypothetical protein DYL72_05645 [Vibrio anguillarum]MBF4309168.1 hypothetical protein [Vibrio anguillarum]MBF4324666.1 hypothetical protein [Vibrio anguillarum]RMZ65938.1 hypothetical protein D9U34_00420 [Vibrio anguillarum]